MATRDGVEKCDTSQALLPATVKQQKLIGAAVKDFPDAVESEVYQQYTLNQNRQNASRLISNILDEHMDDATLDKENYVHYIAYRPRVEKIGTHGLFSGYGEPVVLNAVANEVANHPGNVWTAILSLRREDAQRLGYDNAASWQALINANSGMIAEQMHMDPKNLKWYAAYHDESYHPHIHMVLYSADPKQGYLPTQGIDKIRSTLAGQIFHDELHQIYEQQTVSRKELADTARDEFRKALEQMSVGVAANSKVLQLMPTLSNQLQKSKGKKVYGYLSQDAKSVVNQIVDALAEDDRVATAYEKWYALRKAVLETYRDDAPREPPPLSTQPEFKTIKNIIIKEAWDAICRPENDDEQNPTEREQFGKGNKLELVRKLRKAADGGNDGAACRLASILLNKDGDFYNSAAAIKLLEQAVANDNSLAKYQLGKLLLLGNECEQDVQRAMELLREAADKQKNMYAQYLLGKVYLFGNPVDQDVEKGNRYLIAAASQGNVYAQYLLDHLESRQTANTVMSVTRLMKQVENLFTETEPLVKNRNGGGIDKKRLRILQQKKIAQGHAEDDMDITL